MKNLNGVFWSEKQGEPTDVISIVLITFVAHKLQKHLNFPNTFSYLFHNYDVTSLENIHSIPFWKYAKRC